MNDASSPPPSPPSGPPRPPSPPGTQPTAATGDEVVLFRAFPAATPKVWLKWLITLGIYEFWRRRTQFIVTSRRIVLRHGMVQRTERSVPMNRVQDITTRKGMLHGEVLLSSAGGTLGVESLGPLWNGSVERLAAVIGEQIER